MRNTNVAGEGGEVNIHRRRRGYDSRNDMHAGMSVVDSYSNLQSHNYTMTSCNRLSLEKRRAC